MIDCTVLHPMMKIITTTTTMMMITRVVMRVVSRGIGNIDVVAIDNNTEQIEIV